MRAVKQVCLEDTRRDSVAMAIKRFMETAVATMIKLVLLHPGQLIHLNLTMKARIKWEWRFQELELNSDIDDNNAHGIFDNRDASLPWGAF